MTAAVLRLKVTLNDVEPDPRPAPEGYSDSTATASSGARSHQIGRSRSGPANGGALAASITRAGIW